MFELSDRVALITGSAAGLGLHMASALARAGAIVTMCDINETALEKGRDSIRETGAVCEAFVCDVSHVDEIRSVVDQVIKRFGRIDILVNNAGANTWFVKAEDITDDQWNWVIGINCSAYYSFAREVAPHMKAQGTGRIINMASMHADIDIPTCCWPITAYATSKGAIKEMTKSLAVELSPFGINVNAIAPGYFKDTGLTRGAELYEPFRMVMHHLCPMDRMGEFGDLDGVLYLLASDASSYITGQTIHVDGGWTCT